jgi:Ras-related protein Rab-2A
VWLKDVRQHADPHLTCILVGNKTDLCSDDAGPAKRDREVTAKEAERWAKEEGFLFVETSARSGENVELAFEQATRDILVKIRNGVFDDDRVSVGEPQVPGDFGSVSRLPRYLGADFVRFQSPGVKTSRPSGTNLEIEQSAKNGCCS